MLEVWRGEGERRREVVSPVSRLDQIKSSIDCGLSNYLHTPF